MGKAEDMWRRMGVSACAYRVEESMNENIEVETIVHS